jgi:hypothetical protein
MNNNIQEFADEREKSNADAFLEISLLMIFTSIIIFSALVLFG